MAKVSTGKIIIPGDQIDNYLEAMAEAEAAREPFRTSLKGLNQEFADYLDQKYVKKTVRKHANIVNMFIEFICRQTDVETIEEITKGK